MPDLLLPRVTGSPRQSPSILAAHALRHPPACWMSGNCLAALQLRRSARALQYKAHWPLQIMAFPKTCSTTCRKGWILKLAVRDISDIPASPRNHSDHEITMLHLSSH
jgi:hypothetical protein